jgi:ribonuclease-3
MSESSRESLLSHLATLVGPKPIARIDEALTHPSLPNEDRTASAHYERLEFLGDSVLGLTVAELLFERFPHATEAQLTRMRAALVNADALAAWARRHEVSGAMRLGKGADAAGEGEATSALCDVAEAMLGAIYLDRGMEGARSFVRDVVGTALDDPQLLDARDAKSAFQELAQAHKLGTPSYRVFEEIKDPKRPLVRVEVVLGARVVAVAEGESKRAAERVGAAEALRLLRAELSAASSD